MANKYQRLFCLKFSFKGRSFQPSPAKRRSKIMHTIGVLIKINAPSDCKLEGCPSNLSILMPTHPQTITTKLNMATFRSVLLLVLIFLKSYNYIDTGISPVAVTFTDTLLSIPSRAFALSVVKTSLPLPVRLGRFFPFPPNTLLFNCLHENDRDYGHTLSIFIGLKI